MMKPPRSILHKSFRYVPSIKTSVTDTWRRFSWRPTTQEEREARQARPAGQNARMVLVSLLTPPSEAPPAPDPAVETLRAVRA